MFNLNPVFNHIGNLQGVEPGSKLWNQAGPAAYYGNSGPHGAYGWRHDHLATPDWVRAAIANACHRGCHYDGVPLRARGYDRGGRPRENWVPERPGVDMPDGSVVYLTSEGFVTVTGPEWEHIWLEPLWAVIDANPSEVITTQFGDLPAGIVAGHAARYQAQALMGALRVKEGERLHTGETAGKNTAYRWGFGGRANGRILSTAHQTDARHLLSVDDAELAFDFIRRTLLPIIWGSGPGIEEFGKSPEGVYRFGAYNGIFWTIPVLWDATQDREVEAPQVRGLPDGQDKEGLKAVLHRFSTYVHDLVKHNPQAPEAVSFDITAGLTEPPESIASHIKAVNLGSDPGSAGLRSVWAYRACAIAALVTGSKEAGAAAAKILETHGADPANKKWFVDPLREYVV